ncbi:hypothetical protein KOCBH_A00387 (plasmid) [Klebsiella michiganensis]|nr:hypothetical protein KOCBH_A00387 [Klebsiella michiganensis]
MIHYWVKAIPGETSILDPLRHSVLAIKYLDGAPLLFFNGLLKKDGRSRFWIKYSHAGGLSLGPMHILMMYGLALQNGNILKTECLESHFMDIPCILFTSNSRHYVITEDSVIAARHHVLIKKVRPFSLMTVGLLRRKMFGDLISSIFQN